MCGGKAPPKDNSAELARQQEAARQGRITQGRAAIDKAFAGFDDPYYAKVASDYTSYYTPQLTRKYQDAMRAMTTQLASQGNLTSSAGAEKLGELRRSFGENEASISNAATDAANNLRSQVSAQKSNLYQTNNAAADPSQAASLAGSAAGAIAPAPYTPLGDVFASFLKTANNAAAQEAAGFPGWRTGLFNTSTSGQGSGRLVG